MYQDCFHLIEPLLAKVEKPSRYIDHEWGTLSKADVDYRCCMIYPDVYEVGLPNQGIAILYNILNQAEGISCERGYVPWPDMGDAMREAGIPLLSLEGAAPVASFDIVGMHVPHEMAVTNFLEALDLAGIPLLAADRTEAVTNSYSVLFFGADRNRIADQQQGVAEYAMDAHSDQLATAIHDGNCG